MAPSASDVIVADLLCIPERFGKGFAHAGMARMAKAIYEKRVDTILQALRENPEFDLVITGHSMGAGVAALLTLFLYAQRQDHTSKLPRKTPIRCFGFATPPCFAPLIAAPPGALDASASFIRDDDIVPHLSIEHGRKLFNTLRMIDGLSLGFGERVAILLGLQDPPEELVEAFLTAGGPLECFDEAIPLFVPSSTIIRLSPGEHVETSVIDPRAFQSIGPVFSSSMLLDHLFSYYEFILQQRIADIE